MNGHSIESGHSRPPQERVTVALDQATRELLEERARTERRSMAAQAGYLLAQTLAAAPRGERATP
jgi:hypothetical protein